MHYLWSAPLKDGVVVGLTLTQTAMAKEESAATAADLPQLTRPLLLLLLLLQKKTRKMPLRMLPGPTIFLAVLAAVTAVEAVSAAAASMTAAAGIVTVRAMVSTTATSNAVAILAFSAALMAHFWTPFISVSMLGTAPTAA